MLPVSAPFHCAMMMPAQEPLVKDLRDDSADLSAAGDERGRGNRTKGAKPATRWYAR